MEKTANARPQATATIVDGRECQLTIAPELRRFVENELLPGLGIDSTSFWASLQELITDLTPLNRALLAERDDLQAQIDDWHIRHSDQPWDESAYRTFLEDIGYLVPGGPAFSIDTDNVDPEIASVAGPQLVVPVSNARFALNATNARWGSLYDALYGTDMIPEDDGQQAGDGYNPRRGAAVVAYAARFLDQALELETGSHDGVRGYDVIDGVDGTQLKVTLADGRITGLRDPEKFVGHAADNGRRRILLCNHGLHIQLHIDPENPVGRESASGLCDVHLEAALTTIQDCEDSVAAVDAADKVHVYRNWLGLMRGTLESTFEKGGRQTTRTLQPDQRWTDRHGRTFETPGRSLLLVRNVGHLMTTPAIRDPHGDEVFEGLLDAVMTATAALYDLRGNSQYGNSRTGSVYIVKPKMHGPDEVAFADRLFAAVEDLLQLPRNTLKIGVMDEERRTSANLAECIRQVRHRLVFINTGFLDRTGDEIHTSMEAGPVRRKSAIKDEPWLAAYELNNVAVGIRCGLPGRAQIGKGMWPMPDEMRQMVDTKQQHPLSGANCAWVPSPTAATLHAMHYHAVDVAAIQRAQSAAPVDTLKHMLLPPLGDPGQLSADEIQQELDNNAQGILGYVVRWIDQGVGCSKVPDIDGIGLMEDRATLRISSQHIANWLHHGVCSQDQVMDTFRRMAVVVDDQNKGLPGYQPMAPGFDGTAFRAACALVFEGRKQPNGYTEPLLHAFRAQHKAAG